MSSSCSSSFSIGSHDGRTVSAGVAAASGDGGVTKSSLSRAELRVTFLFFLKDDVVNVSCLCSSGTTRGREREGPEEMGGVCHGGPVVSLLVDSWSF